MVEGHTKYMLINFSILITCSQNFIAVGSVVSEENTRNSPYNPCYSKKTKELGTLKVNV